MLHNIGWRFAILSSVLGCWESSHAAEPSPLVSGGIRFEERLIWSDGHYVYGLTATDIDHDGDFDFSAAGVFSDTFVWFENDGRQGFTRRSIDSSPTTSPPPVVARM